MGTQNKQSEDDLWNAAILFLTIVDIGIFVAMEETATAICALHICCPGDEAGFCVKCQ